MLLKILKHYKEWDKLVVSFPDANIFQSETYFRFLKETYGWCEKYHLLVEDKGNHDIVALALVFLKKRYSFLPAFLGTPEICFGPLIKNLKNKRNVQEALNLLLKGFDHLCCQNGFSSSVVLPPPQSVSSRFIKPSRFREDDSYCTFLVDLKEDEDKIFSKLSSSWRKYVNRGYRDLTLKRIEDSSDPMLSEIYQIHKEKIERLRRENVSINYTPFSFFKKTVDLFVKNGAGQYLVGIYNGEIVSSDCTIGFGDFGNSWLADTSRKYPKLKASHVLRWEGILWSKRQGYEFYDFGQVAPGPFEKIPKNAQGVYIFKQRFGGNYSVAYKRYQTYSSSGKKFFDLLLKPYLLFLDIKNRL